MRAAVHACEREVIHPVHLYYVRLFIVLKVFNNSYDGCSTLIVGSLFSVFAAALMISFRQLRDNV